MANNGALPKKGLFDFRGIKNPLPKPSLGAVGSIAGILVIAGLLYYVISNKDSLLEKANNRLDGYLGGGGSNALPEPESPPLEPLPTPTQAVDFTPASRLIGRYTPFYSPIITPELTLRQRQRNYNDYEREISNTPEVKRLAQQQADAYEQRKIGSGGGATSPSGTTIAPHNPVSSGGGGSNSVAARQRRYNAAARTRSNTAEVRQQAQRQQDAAEKRKISAPAPATAPQARNSRQRAQRRGDGSLR